MKINLKLDLGSFNVRGLSSSTKQQCLAADSSNYHCDIICLQETKIQDTLDTKVGNHRILTFNPTCRHYGLGFTISPEVNKHVYDTWAVNDRIAVLRLRYDTDNSTSKNNFISIINVYGPTSTLTKKDVNIREKFYEDLEETVKELKKDTIIICGDFNSKIGQISDPNESLCMGQHSRGRRNENGSALIEFCLNNHFFISNSAFKHKARHITTWQGQISTQPEGKTKFIYNQIDYILVQNHTKRHLTNARTYAGTLTTSDHRLLITSINFDSQIIKPKRKHEQPKIKFSVHSLADEDKKCSFQQTCNKNLYAQYERIDGSAQELLNVINETLTKTAEEVLPKITNIRHKETFCPTIENLSRKQKELRLQIQSTSDEEIKTKKKQERNKILHQIRQKALDNANQRIDYIVDTISKSSDSHQMFQALNLIRRKHTQAYIIQDGNGHLVKADKDKLKILHDYFSNKYNGPNCITHRDEDPNYNGPLDNPITPREVKEAINKLNNNRAVGPDGIPAELLKAAPDNIIELIADTINWAVHDNDDLKIGAGKLILLPKPGKPKGPPGNLRPIVLLPALRKVISLIALERTKDKIEEYLSPSQAGFRANRSTSDIVWTHRWMVSRIQKYKEEYTILGIDLSSAFDTVDRKKLLDVVKTFLDQDHVKLIRLLLSNTSLELSSGQETTTINTILGSPQGDSFSPRLFIVYLEAALREARLATTKTSPINPSEMIYADDADFLFRNKSEAKQNLSLISTKLEEWNLKVNQTKTEITSVSRDSDEWKTVRKLGSLLNTEEDMEKRKTLATIAFNNMFSLWTRRERLQEQKMLKLYNAIVLPILTYNCGTWGPTKAQAEAIDRFHRKQLRRMLGIKWDDKITNTELYARTGCKPITHLMLRARWRLFGHVLRRNQAIPAQQAMDEYFKEGQATFRGRRPTTLPSTLDHDLHSILPHPSVTHDHNYARPLQLKSAYDLNTMRKMAEDRESWRSLIQSIIERSQAG